MTKDQYYRQHSIARFTKSCNQPKPTFTLKVLNRLLKRIYGTMLTPQGEAFCRLVCRYRSKVNKHHLSQYRQYHKQGKISGKNLLSNLVYGLNPFLALVSKESQI